MEPNQFASTATNSSNASKVHNQDVFAMASFPDFLGETPVQPHVGGVGRPAPNAGPAPNGFLGEVPVQSQQNGAPSSQGSDATRRPWLTVAMPTYNGERYLATALASLEQAGVDEIEIIAVDDGSTDSTPRILEQFQHRLPLTVLLQKHVGNWTVNTNRAMSLARGTHLCWLHQDDVWRPGRLRRLQELINEYPDAPWYFHSSEFIAPDGRGVGTWRCPFPAKTAAWSAPDVWSRLLVQCYVASCAPIFSVKALHDAGELDESLWYSADWDFWLRLSQLGSGVYDPRPWTGFRIHAASQTATRFADSVEFERQQRGVLRRHLQSWQALHGHIHDGNSVDGNSLLGHSKSGHTCVERMAELSITMNVALASFTAGRRVNWSAVVADAWRARPWHWWRFLEHSRLWDRAGSRWRLRREFAGNVPAALTPADFHPKGTDFESTAQPLR